MWWDQQLQRDRYCRPGGHLVRTCTRLRWTKPTPEKASEQPLRTPGNNSVSSFSFSDEPEVVEGRERKNVTM